MTNRINMMNDVITKYGFEAKETIDFCTLCEDKLATDYVVFIAYSYLMK